MLALSPSPRGLLARQSKAKRLSLGIGIEIESNRFEIFCEKRALLCEVEFRVLVEFLCPWALGVCVCVIMSLG